MVGRALMGTVLALALAVAGCGGSTTTVTQTSTVTQTRTEMRTTTVVKHIAAPSTPAGSSASDGFASSYPVSFDSSFIHTCLVHGNSGSCQCALREIKRAVSYGTVLEDAHAILTATRRPGTRMPCTNARRCDRPHGLPARLPVATAPAPRSGRSTSAS